MVEQVVVAGVGGRAVGAVALRGLGLLLLAALGASVLEPHLQVADKMIAS